MIKASKLSFRYPNQAVNALDRMDLTVSPGETVLLSGPTGCGKSTLGLSLCGAIPALISGRLSGHLRVNGHGVSTRPIRETARELGFLLQNVESQTFTHGVADEIAFGLENFSVPPKEMNQRVETALKRVDGSHLLNRSLSTLSAGERQRVMLAAMLALDQKVLVLDEPLAYLDHTARKSLLSLLGGLSEKGRSVLVFEHRRDLMATMDLREIYMEKGRKTQAPAVSQAFPKVRPCRPGKTALKFDRVSFAWPHNQKPLFSNVSFRVRQQESVVLRGNNGSGKTTLMTMALGLVKPLYGVVTTWGLDAATTPPATLAAHGSLIFQLPDHQLYLPHVRQEIQSQARDRDTAAAELQAMGLTGLENRHPRSLSMGQKRRLTLAAALAGRPRLLLLDEPSVGQDDASLALIINRLDQFVRRGGALLTATHDDRVARALGHRILEIENKQIKENQT